MKKKFKIRKLIKLILILILVLCFYAVGVSTFELIKKNNKLNEFKSRAYETTTVVHYDVTYYYHKVKRTHTYELNDKRSVFYDEDKLEPGLDGDILLAYGSPFPYIPVLDPVISFMFGGHASLVAPNNRIIESTGIAANGLLNFELIKNVVLHQGYDEENEFGVSIQKRRNYWLTPYRTESHAEYPYYGAYFRDEIFAVRPKISSGANVSDVTTNAVAYADDKVNRGLYNYLFAFNTKYKFYCSDLISRAYSSINSTLGTEYNLNQDGFVTTIGDILLSSDVYITIYKETINEEIHLYYLEDLI